ncbi:MAG TPA: hypothetical protein VGC95_00050, partial [Chitinophagaceae bacterium]
LRHNERKATNDILTHFHATVFLKDANEQTLDSISVLTGDYGSFAGKFVLRFGRLNGRFTISANGFANAREIAVEEYKRPKFRVELSQPASAYRTGDTETVNGVATSYSGGSIDRATVHYRVNRRARIIYDYYRKGGWFPTVQQMEIAYGEETTGKDGSFHIPFTAIPDPQLPAYTDPVFDYELSVDVTDRSGETRSASTIVVAGYRDIMLNLDVPASMEADSFKRINVTTTNLAGRFLRATVTATIYSLTPPSRLIRERYWERPDQFLMSREQYLQRFPLDEYDNELDKDTWPRNAVMSQRANLQKETDGITTGKKLQAGEYAIEVITIDKSGKPLKDVKYFNLFDPNSRQVPGKVYLSAAGGKASHPGGKTTVTLATACDQVTIFEKIQRRVAGNDSLLVFGMNAGQQQFEFKATEADRGGFGIDFSFVRNNRFFNYSALIDVPWSEKELKVEYTSMRDKALPGQEERWTLKVTGGKQEVAGAEVLASLYDASLDQFHADGWQIPGIWPGFLPLGWFHADGNFQVADSRSGYNWVTHEKQLDKRYDHVGGSWLDVSSPRQGRVMEVRMTGQKNLADAALSKYVVADSTSGSTMNGNPTVTKRIADVS